MSNAPIDGIGGLGKASSVSADPRPEETPFQPGNFAKYDMDGEGTAMPMGVYEFDGNGQVPMRTISDKVMLHEELADKYGPVANDVAQWAARSNGLSDPDSPIPNGKRVSLPVHELKSMLRLLEPKLKQVLMGGGPVTVTTASGAHAQVTGNVQSMGMPLLLDD